MQLLRCAFDFDYDVFLIDYDMVLFSQRIHWGKFMKNDLQVTDSNVIAPG